MSVQQVPGDTKTTRYVCMCVCLLTVCVQCLYRRTKEDVRAPGTGVTNLCELPPGCWEFNPGPLEEYESSQLLSHLSSCRFNYSYRTWESKELVLSSATGVSLFLDVCLLPVSWWMTHDRHSISYRRASTSELCGDLGRAEEARVRIPMPPGGLGWGGVTQWRPF